MSNKLVEFLERTAKVEDIEKYNRITDLMIRIEDIIKADEVAIELFERIVKGIETVYEIKDGKRVLDISLEYNNYKWKTRDNYSKRFKNEEEVKNNENEQNG